MSNAQSTLRIREKANLDREIDAFLIDRCARSLSPHTIKYYDGKLALFRAYLQAQGIRAVESVTAPIVRRFLLDAIMPLPGSQIRCEAWLAASCQLRALQVASDGGTSAPSFRE